MEKNLLVFSEGFTAKEEYKFLANKVNNIKGNCNTQKLPYVLPQR
jgi:hypothetical protein